jgi:YesN/AraC family two-component response regulator
MQILCTIFYFKYVYIFIYIHENYIHTTLGYDDYAYFTRLFTRASALSSVQFRKKYFK